MNININIYIHIYILYIILQSESGRGMYILRSGNLCSKRRPEGKNETTSVYKREREREREREKKVRDK